MINTEHYLNDSLDTIIYLPRKNSLILTKVPVSSPLKPISHPSGSIFTSIQYDEILKNFPGMVSWKNNSFHYLGCNQRFAHAFDLSSPSVLEGSQDADLSWNKGGYSPIFKDEDQEIISGFIMTILGKYHFFDKERLVLIKKIPIVNHLGSVVGIFSYITHLYQKTIHELILFLKDLDIDINPEQCNLIQSLFFKPEPKLSAREEECAKYILHGLSSKEIAKMLGLSYRTIEIYLSSLKEKLDCRKTSSLIVKLISLGYQPQR